VFWGLQIHNDKLTWNNLEEGRYNEDETILLKLPMALPYPVYDNDYRPMQEEFEHDGSYYKGIKQKLEGDTIYILCVKDVKKKGITNAFTKYAKETNNLPTDKKGNSIFNKLLKEYEPLTPYQVIQQQGWCIDNVFILAAVDISSHASPVLAPPPRI
jgi:hypothetical protein